MGDDEDDDSVMELDEEDMENDEIDNGLIDISSPSETRRKVEDKLEELRLKKLIQDYDFDFDDLN